VQLAPATSALQLLAFVAEKGAAVVALTATVEAPVLDTITVAAAVVPTLCFPNDRLVGETLIDVVVDEAPVPDRGIACGLLEALSLMVTAPVRVPVAVGVKFTLIKQLAPAATEPPQVPVPEKAKSPLIRKLLLKVRDEVPVLVSVTDCVALVVPTLVLGKVSEAGERLTVAPELDDPPVPESGMICGVLGALSNRLTCAVRVPEAVGVNFRLTVQLPPVATVPPTPGQVPRPPKAKSPLFVPVMVKALLIVRAELPVLLRVTNDTLLVLPTNTAPKFTEAGERLTTGPLEEAPVPVRLADRAVAPAVIPSAAVLVPVAAGSNVTLIVQLALAARLVLQVVDDTLKSALLVPVIAGVVRLTAAAVPFLTVTACAALVVPTV